MRGIVMLAMVGLVAAGGCGDPTGLEIVNGTYSVVATDSLGATTFEGILTLRFSGDGRIAGGWDIRRVFGASTDHPAALNGHGLLGGNGTPGARQTISLSLATDAAGVTRELTGQWGTYVSGFNGNWRVLDPDSADGGAFTAIRVSNDELSLPGS